MPNISQVLTQIQQITQAGLNQAQSAGDIVRRSYLQELHKATGRNVIAYYSGFLSKPGILQVELNDEDKNGFMMAVHQLDRTIGLDLILHTPGGSIAATQSIVNYLHKMFDNDIRCIVPQIAMSAGAMIACSCQRIVMTKHSNLGPIDPHLDGLPAAGVLKEFQRACDEVAKDPSRTRVWQSIIGQYPPTFLGRCKNAIDWSNAFVRNELTTVMFAGEADAAKRARRAVAFLSSDTINKTHNRHLHYEDLKDRLVVDLLEDDPNPQIQDLVLTVHHSYMHALMNTAAYKMIENHMGIALVQNATPATAMRMT